MIHPPRLIPVLALLAALVLTSAAPAASITFHVTANTSGFSGPPSGTLEMVFNPASPGLSQAATVTITNLAGGTLVGAPTMAPPGPGGFTGTFPGPLSIDNTFVSNGVDQGYTYGSTLSFDLTLSGPAVDAPNNNGFGSTFLLTLFDSGFMPLLSANDPSYPDAALVLTLSSAGGVTTVTGPGVTATQVVEVGVPEPATGLLLGACLAAGAVGLARRRRVTRG